ncbi:MAG: hypothetical protein ACREGK_15915 [Geminicoccales bacterium]
MAVAVLVSAFAGPSAGSGQIRPFVQFAPPTAKDALRLVMRNAGIALPQGGSCDGVDTTGIANPTIGDYLGGFLAELAPAPGVSGIAANCTGEPSDLACEVTIQRDAGDEVWAWGLRFRADGITGDIRPESLECTGAG